METTNNILAGIPSAVLQRELLERSIARSERAFTATKLCLEQLSAKLGRLYEERRRQLVIETNLHSALTDPAPIINTEACS